MRISRRTSGGRGEYEISENAGDLTPRELFGRRIILDLGNRWQIDTRTVLTGQGGKRRLRRLERDRDHIQVHLQLAAALMLPHPVREDQALGRGLPIARQDQYAIEHVHIEEVEVRGADTARLVPVKMILQNGSYQAHSLEVAERREQVERIWAHARKLPEQLAVLVVRHRQLVHAGGPVCKDAERVVVDLQVATTAVASDLGILYRSEAEDVLPHLLQALKWAEEPPAPPIAVTEVEPEDVDIKRRVVKEWKRWANARGAGSAVFRQQVRRAYNSTCIVCGIRLPPTRFNAAGVEAAHILPWADYDLDKVVNGVCLCRQHHWAFDEGLIVIDFRDGKYFVEIPDEVEAGIAQDDPGFSLAELRRCVGLIPAARLPQRAQDRPNPQLLRKLRENS